MKKEELQHFLLVTYSIAEKKQHEKVRIIRELFGYSETKDKKTYKHKGQITKWYGKKLGPGVLLIPAGFGLQVSTYMQNNKIQITIQEIWME